VTVIILDTMILNTHTTDTVYQFITKDSIIIKEVEKIVYHTDTVTIVDLDTVEIIRHDTVTLTVYDRTVVYLDTLFIPGYIRPTWDVPLDLMPHLEEFFELSRQYGYNAELGMLIVHYTNDLPGENWISSSFKMGDNDQWVIFLDQRLPAVLHRSSMFRELGRLSLNKKYSNDPARIMSPLFKYDAPITQKHLDELFK
jgi:hypothetical protein